MFEYKIALGTLASVLALGSYAIYFTQIVQNQVKPHAFSWFVWGLTTAIIFAAQISKQGGAGAWMTGITSVSCFIICAVSLFKGERDFVVLDWIFLGVALLSLILWKLTKNPTLSVILSTATDAAGVLPTLRKAYSKPADESLTLFSIGSFKALISLLALQSYNLVTQLYPAMLLVVNPLVVLVIIFRKRKLKRL